MQLDKGDMQHLDTTNNKNSKFPHRDDFKIFEIFLMLFTALLNVFQNFLFLIKIELIIVVKYLT